MDASIEHDNLQRQRPAHLDPSPLGTQSYWDEAYQAELKSSFSLTSRGENEENDEEEGETNKAEEEDEGEGVGINWFSEYNASTKMVDYLIAHDELGYDPDSTTFLDLGTGNGHLLFELRDRGGFRGHMVGVDYSAASIQLAIAAAQKKAVVPETRFQHWDILRDDSAFLNLSPPPPPFDVVLDKGTFDAVCLSQEVDKHGRRLCEGYPGKVAALLKEETGRFIITSCNWTEDELLAWFEGGAEGLDATGLKACDRIEYPRFQFGGKSGQSLSSVVFLLRRGRASGS